MTQPTSETITFELHLLSEFWNTPPLATITLDGCEYFNGPVPAGSTVVKFTHTCEFDQPHRLTLDRQGKTVDEIRTEPDGTRSEQYLTIEKIKIDGVDIRNIIWTYSVNVPIYPEPWASMQIATGNQLNKEVIGETRFGHNGTWHLDFTSPFYIFIMHWMGGGLH